MNTVDISGLEQALISAAVVILGPLAAYVALRINKALGIAQNSAAATRVQTGVEALADAAHGELVSLAEHNPTIEIKNKAVANAVATVSDGLSEATKLTGTTPAQLTQRVLGALQTKLNSAPIVTTAATPATSYPSTPTP
jgi:hypothetical protein